MRVAQINALSDLFEAAKKFRDAVEMAKETHTVADMVRCEEAYQELFTAIGVAEATEEA